MEVEEKPSQPGRFGQWDELKVTHVGNKSPGMSSGDTMFLQELAERTPFFSREPGGLADISSGTFHQLVEILIFKLLENPRFRQ